MKEQKLSDNIPKYIKYLENIKNSSPHTLVAYQKDLFQAYPSQIQEKYLNESELLNVTRKGLDAWSGLSLSTKNRKISVLKSFLKWLFEENLTSKNLGLLLYSPKIPQKIPNFISIDEALSILRSYSQADLNTLNLNEDKSINKLDLIDLQDLLLFLLLYGSGLRISEACSIKWIDIQWNKHTFLIKGKGSKERIVPFPRLTFLALTKLKETSEGIYIWGNAPLSTRKGYEIIRQRGAKAQLMKPIHPHALRHSFATHVLTSGANLRTLQEMLGHESLQATQKYTHLGMDALARTMENHHPLGEGKKK